MPRYLINAFLGISILLALVIPAPVHGAADGFTLSSPRRANQGHAVAVTMLLPQAVAAVEGRVIVHRGSAKLLGVAPAAQGIALRPVSTFQGEAFAAYGLQSGTEGTLLRLVLIPTRSGHLQVRVVVDAAADAAGGRLAVRPRQRVAVLRVDGSATVLTAPDATPVSPPQAPAERVRDVLPDGRIDQQDVDVLRAGWDAAKAGGPVCDGDPTTDANGDGCIDVVDLQATLAAIGTTKGRISGPAPDGALANDVMAQSTVESTTATFRVNSTGDEPDASVGNGECATSSGSCTLRAALMEANNRLGNERIEFGLTGTAPVLIQLQLKADGTPNPLPYVTSRAGTVTIDGYSQSGSQVNTSAVGSNAVLGIELRGNGPGKNEVGLRITSPGNTVRGLLVSEVNRAVFLDGVDARDNRIVGNRIGLRRDGTVPAQPRQGVTLNSGANRNFVGTPQLADRNIIYANHAIENYGPGVDANVIQNNALCMTPSGMGVAKCAVGIDHNFGPKETLIGGTGINERNVIGATNNQAIELSHGWDPSKDAATGGELKYQINGHRVIGNWLGFRGDGSYHVDFRSGSLNNRASDNGQGVNVYDGANDNLVEGNWIASRWEGISFMSGNAQRNTARNNVIGVSPKGEAAPLAGWGLELRINTRDHVIVGNTIRNAQDGGIGLIESNVSNVRISRNIVTDTPGHAIDLYGIPGPDPNDPGDANTGANGLLNTPENMTATTHAVSGSALPGATVEVFRASRAQGGYGLPTEFLGEATVGSDGRWSVPVSGVSNADRITALQIRSNGETSELAPNVTAGEPGPAPAPVADFTAQQRSGTLTVDLTDTSSGAPTSWAWDLDGIPGTDSTAQHPSHTYLAAGSYAVTLTASNASGSSSKTSTVIVSPPPSSGTVAVDTFGRTVVDGWGNAETGGAWALSGTAADFDVDGSRGTMRLPSAGANRAAMLPGVSQRDVDLTVQTSLDKVPAGGSVWIYGPVRQSGSGSSLEGYRPKLRIGADGSVEAHAGRVVNGSETSLGTPVRVAGLTVMTGSSLWLRTQVVGADPTTVRVRAWAAGQTEPTDWHFTATDTTTSLQDAGAVGLRVYAAGTVSNMPITAAFDDFSVTAVP